MSILETARKHSKEVSVRSGGHSYTCTNIKEGGVHIDMREFTTLELEEGASSPSGLALRLGPGRVWGEVLEFAPPSRYSYPHGQCRSVGVGPSPHPPLHSPATGGWIPAGRRSQLAGHL